MLSAPDFVPAIYYYNEEDQFLEEQINSVFVDNTISLKLDHFSRYALLGKREQDEVWEYILEYQPITQNRNSLDVVFVIDSSGSMSWNDKTEIRKEVTNNFIDKLTSNDRAAVVSFASYAYELTGFTGNKETLKNAVNSLGCSGGTDIGAGISMALDLFKKQPLNDNKLKSIVLLTDGDGAYSYDYNKEAKDNNIIIYTVGLGSGVRTSVLTDIADKTGGKYFYANNASNLYNIFDSIYEKTDLEKDYDEDGLSDYHEKAMTRGELRLGTGVPLKDIDYQKPDSDYDGLKDGEEIIIAQRKLLSTMPKEVVYVKMYSNPTIPDTDGDGINDKDDLHPLVKDDSTASTNKYKYIARVTQSGDNNHVRKGAGTGFDDISDHAYRNEGDIVWVYEEKTLDNGEVWVRISSSTEDKEKWFCKEQTGKIFLEKVTDDDIQNEYQNIIAASELSIIKDDYILICNAVAQEAGSDVITVAEKELIVEVIMNRLNNTAIFEDQYDIYTVIKEEGAFSNSNRYIDLKVYSDLVTNDVITAVKNYLQNAYNYKDGYLYFCAGGDGHNYFSKEHPTDGQELWYKCPGQPDRKFTAVNGVQKPVK